jgi:uncharacterized protein YecE (DUF72 family)
MAHEYGGLKKKIFIGTAGWTIPGSIKDFFPDEGSHLERYAEVLRAVEINSSFYNDHKPQSYSKWAESTPHDFRFSIKLHQRFTHENDKFLTQDLGETLSSYNELGDKWAVLLLQFPPGLGFDPFFLENLLESIRHSFLGSIAVEPRNSTWHCTEFFELMKTYGATKVIADPDRCFVANSEFENIGGISYLRYHGSPVIYRSEYGDDILRELKEKIQLSQHDLWCIFDNTTFGHATKNALKLKGMTERTTLS